MPLCCKFMTQYRPGSRLAYNSSMERIRNQLELLHALSGVDLCRIDVPFRVDSHGVNPVELAGLPAVAAKAADHAAVVAFQDADFVVFAVGAEQPSLLRVRPDRDVPHGAIAERVLLVKP